MDDNLNSQFQARQAGHLHAGRAMAAGMSDHPKIKLTAATPAHAVRGQPWVYANNIEMNAATKAIAPGSVVRLAESNGRWLGLYHFNPHSLIAARLLSRNHERAIDAGFYRERLDAALALRQRLFGRPFYRLVHAEGDGLPGLVIDRYGDSLVIQPGTAGMEADLPLLLQALKSLLKPASIDVIADSRARSLEGLEPVARRELGPESQGPLELVENGVTYVADPLGGQKTGWFFDHRRNRAFLKEIAGGAEVLDLYSYSGAFGLACAAGGAASVLSIDRSEPAMALARRAAALNGLETRWRGEAAEVFDWLDKADARHDIVIADPPAFAKAKKDVPAARKGYEKLARLAAQRVKAGGLLALASCSHHVDAPHFLASCTEGLREGGRAARLIHSAGAGPDHPVHPLLPQTAYLKFNVFSLS
jgi:23S rRNA (cytosine1962-C5)-methyltransferase